MSSFITDISKLMNMNLGLMLKQSKITIIGKNIVIIEGVTCIKEYTCDKVVVVKGKTNIIVNGCGLNIKCLSQDEIIVEGRIEGISL